MVRAAAIAGLVMTLTTAPGAVVAQNISPLPQDGAWQSAGGGSVARGSGEAARPPKKDVPPLAAILPLPRANTKSVRPETTTAQIVVPQAVTPSVKPMWLPPETPVPPRWPTTGRWPLPPATTGFSTEPFSEADVLAGKQVTEAQCAAHTSAVWVVVGGTGECIVYYRHDDPDRTNSPQASNIAWTADGTASDNPYLAAAGQAVIVFLSGDVVMRGEAKVYPSYLKTTPAQMKADSSNKANSLRHPYIAIGRLGSYGSSGHYANRRSEREIAVMSAALDAIKARHGYLRLHLTGFSEGAHTAAMLMTRRDDLGCVVLANGLLSVKQYLAEHNRTADWTGNKAPLDPVAVTDKIVRSPALRILVMTDPDDLYISARSQMAYMRKLKGLPAMQVFSAASDAAAHNLINQAQLMTADCAASNYSDEILRSKYENKVPVEPPDADDPPLHRPDTLRREVSITEAQCAALKTALWLTVDGRKVCIRYWLSTAGGIKSEALVFLDGDLGSNDGGRLALNPAAERISAGQVQRIAHLWSRNYGGPYVELARVGTLGSSGSHTKDRRTLFEIRVASAALEALKTKFGWTRLHVVGQSGGGHTVAGLARQRDDIGCAVMASGAVAVKLMHLYRGMQVGDNVRSKYDPYDQVLDKPFPPKLRMVVMSDPMDRIVSYGSQAAFVKLVRLTNTPIVHLLTDARDKNHHGLASTGIRAAIDCAKGVSDQDLIKTYHNTTARVARF